MYKMAVLDIDGTMINDKGSLSRRTVQTIQKVQDRGFIVTVCTGRNIKRALPIIKKAGIRVPFSCIDGALLYDPIKGEVLGDLLLNKERVLQVLEFLDGRDVFIELSDGNKYFKYIKNKEMLQYDIFNRHDVLGRIKSHLQGIRYTQSYDFLKSIAYKPIYQMVVAAQSSVLLPLAEEIRSLGLEDLDIRDKVWNQFLFINQRGIRKMRGVEKLCAYFQIPLSSVVTIGDEMNDLDMIQEAGFGIAMGNAVDAIKEVSRFVTLTNNEDGVAYALEKFFLK